MKCSPQNVRIVTKIKEDMLIEISSNLLVMFTLYEGTFVVKDMNGTFITNNMNLQSEWPGDMTSEAHCFKKE